MHSSIYVRFSFWILFKIHAIPMLIRESGKKTPRALPQMHNDGLSIEDDNSREARKANKQIYILDNFLAYPHIHLLFSLLPHTSWLYDSTLFSLHNISLCTTFLYPVTLSSCSISRRNITRA